MRSLTSILDATAIDIAKGLRLKAKDRDNDFVELTKSFQTLADYARGRSPTTTEPETPQRARIDDLRDSFNGKTPRTGRNSGQAEADPDF